MLTTERIVGMQEDVSGALKYVNANKAPFYLNLLNLGNVEEAKSTTVSWVDYSCEGTQSVLSEQIEAEATSINVPDTTPFNDGCYARIEEEVVLVSTVGVNCPDISGTLTVVRGQFSTDKVVHKAGTPIYFINDNIEEGADLKGATYKAGANFDNYTQIIREEIEVSGTAAAISVPSGEGIDAYSLEQTRKTDFMVGKMEKALVAGKKFLKGKTRGMDGIRNILDKGQVVDAGASTITLDIFGTLLEKAYLAGADLQNGYYAFYVPPKQQANITKLLDKYLKKESGDTVLGAAVTHILTDYGIIPIIMTPNIPNTEILLVNHEDCKLRPLSNRNLTHTYMGMTGDNVKGLLVAELTLEVRNVHTQGKIVNLGV